MPSACLPGWHHGWPPTTAFEMLEMECSQLSLRCQTMAPFRDGSQIDRRKSHVVGSWRRQSPSGSPWVPLPRAPRDRWPDQCERRTGPPQLVLISDDRIGSGDDRQDLTLPVRAFHHIACQDSGGWRRESRRVIGPGRALVVYEHLMEPDHGAGRQNLPLGFERLPESPRRDGRQCVTRGAGKC
jgi:hypothetical protein